MLYSRYTAQWHTVLNMTNSSGGSCMTYFDQLFTSSLSPALCDIHQHLFIVTITLFKVHCPSVAMGNSCCSMGHHYVISTYDIMCYITPHDKQNENQNQKSASKLLLWTTLMWMEKQIDTWTSIQWQAVKCVYCRWQSGPVIGTVIKRHSMGIGQ